MSDAKTIITRRKAKSQGLTRYYTGKTCVNGHDSERYVRGDACVVCLTASTRRWERENADRVAAQGGWLNAKVRGAALPVEFPNVVALLDATMPIYAEARRLSETTGIKHEVDHLIPASRGGSHHPKNLKVVPAWFNNAKNDRTPCEYLQALTTNPRSRSRYRTQAIALATSLCVEQQAIPTAPRPSLDPRFDEYVAEYEALTLEIPTLPEGPEKSWLVAQYERLGRLIRDMEGGYYRAA